MEGALQKFQNSQLTIQSIMAMCKSIFFLLTAQCLFAHIHAQTPGYLSVLNTAGTTGTSGNMTFNYSVGEAVAFANSCSYTAGVIQPHCLLFVLVTEEFDQKYKANFFPNPTTNQVVVETDFTDFTTYTINSVDGKTLESCDFNYSPIDFGKFESGTYLLRLSTSNNHIFKTVKIIKQ